MEALKSEMNRREFLKYGLGCTAGVAGVSTFLLGCNSAYRFQNRKIVGNNPNPGKQEYLNQDFLDYPEELGKLCDKYWVEGKPVEYLSALSRQLFAITNDIAELPFEAAGSIGDIVGYNLLGGKARGEKNKRIVRNFVKYTFDSITGGKGNDKIVGLIVKGDIGGAFEYAHKLEDTELGANLKIGMIGYSNYLIIDSALKGAFGGENWLIRQKDGGWVVAGETPGPTPGDPF